jgi:hypothetical protein
VVNNGDVNNCIREKVTLASLCIDAFCLMFCMGHYPYCLCPPREPLCMLVSK